MELFLLFRKTKSFRRHFPKTQKRRLETFYTVVAPPPPVGRVDITRRVEPDEAWRDFSKAWRLLEKQETSDDDDVRRRITVYMNQIRDIRRKQKEIHGNMFKADEGIYNNKADVKEGEEVEEPEVDDTDEAIERALQSTRESLRWSRGCCACRRRESQGRPKTD